MDLDLYSLYSAYSPLYHVYMLDASKVIRCFRDNIALKFARDCVCQFIRTHTERLSFQITLNYVCACVTRYRVDKEEPV